MKTKVDGREIIQNTWETGTKIIRNQKIRSKYIYNQPQYCKWFIVKWTMYSCHIYTISFHNSCYLRFLINRFSSSELKEAFLFSIFYLTSSFKDFSFVCVCECVCARVISASTQERRGQLFPWTKANSVWVLGTKLSFLRTTPLPLPSLQSSASRLNRTGLLKARQTIGQMEELGF